MVMDRTIEGEGTSEREWLADPDLCRVRSITSTDLFAPEQRLVICAPHPDDEILPCAGSLVQRGAGQLLILAITDGEMSHPMLRDTLKEVRPRESQASIEALDVPAEVTRLGFADGQLQPSLPALTRAIAATLRPDDCLLAPWGLDGHPDHEATYQAAAAAANLAGAAPPIEMPIWAWHWCRPHHNPIPWSRAVKVPITQEALQRKHQAIAQFTTQICRLDGEAPILTERTLQRFLRPWEIFFPFHLS